MPERRSDDHVEGFSEIQAKRILVRAAELDASGAPRFTAADLQRIAEEATIHTSAIDLALTEATTAGLAQAAPSTRWSSVRASLLRAGGLLGLGAGLGALAVAADAMSLGPESAAAVFGPGAAFVLYRALWHRWHGSVRGFIEEVVLVLGPFTLTVTALEGFHATNPALLWSLICAGVGGAVAGLELRTTATRSSTITTSPD